MKSTLLHGVNLICIVARHQSLTSAAKELNLTLGAVSQQLQHKVAVSVISSLSREQSVS